MLIEFKEYTKQLNRDLECVGIQVTEAQAELLRAMRFTMEEAIDYAKRNFAQVTQDIRNNCEPFRVTGDTFVGGTNCVRLIARKDALVVVAKAGEYAYPLKYDKLRASIDRAFGNKFFLHIDHHPISNCSLSFTNIPLEVVRKTIERLSGGPLQVVEGPDVTWDDIEFATFTDETEVEDDIPADKPHSIMSVEQGLKDTLVLWLDLDTSVEIPIKSCTLYQNKDRGEVGVVTIGFGGELYQIISNNFTAALTLRGLLSLNCTFSHTEFDRDTDADWDNTLIQLSCYAL